MTRLGRLQRRRARHSDPAHRRARELMSQRFDEPLEATDESWLTEHLAGCDSCRAIAAEYEADHLALLGLRDIELAPPRDLWARTSAAIEQEKGSRRGASSRPTGPSSARRRPPLGVLSGVAVIAVVIGASLISGGWLDAPAGVAVVSPSASAAVALASPAPTPVPTPILVGAGDVRWVGTGPDGLLAYNITDIDRVCAEERQTDCAPIGGGDATPVDLSIKPTTIVKSPVGNDAVVVGDDGAGGDSIIVFALPTARTIGSASPKPTPISTPVRTPEPTPADTPSATPTTDPSATPTTDPSPTTEPTTEPTASPTDPPSETPAPTKAANLAIATGVKVVGGSAAYSPDGEWFAFTARAADGSAGPDIYVWRVGDDMARALTDDHSSVFASWSGDQLIGSRAPGLSVDTPDPVDPESFRLDPLTGEETTTTSPIWRPVVGPHGRWAVGWDGSIGLAADGSTMVPVDGSLMLDRVRGGEADPNGSVDLKIDGPIGDYDVRWDETGTWLAIWVADASDPALGRLSLIHVDPATGELERPKGAPQDMTALPGFSIGDGRLAWATPPGQGGEGSRVQIVAWTDDAVGAVESGPVDGVILIH
jgi:predicted anti-sigma-YlaC factor YlaD